LTIFYFYSIISLMSEMRPIEVVTDPFSLDSLRYEEPFFDEPRNKEVLLTPAAVNQFMEVLNEVPEDDKLVVIGIGTGGTIAMSPKGPKGSLVPDLDFKSIIKNTDPRLEDEFHVVSFDAFSTDSSQLDIDDIGDMAIAMSYIWREMPDHLKERFAGFLIVHGTDTMPKSGGHLEMMLGPDVPFNFEHTGAQKSINEKINDAQRNVKESLYLLKMLHRNGKADGLTVMGGLGLLTAGITKVSDHAAQAMWTHLHRPAVRFDELPDPDTHILPDWLRDQPVLTDGFMPLIYRGPNRVGELRAEMQEDPLAIEAAISHSGRAAMMLVTYGANTYDVAAINAIGRFTRDAENSIPVFAISPVNADPKLDIYAAGVAMQEAGVQPVHMTPEALRAKAMRVIAEVDMNPQHHSLSPDRRSGLIKARVVKNLVGEVPTARNRRDPYTS
jgi:L-asparaginase/Glu-tRNA(Gln) amidotransferase subunit D